MQINLVVIVCLVAKINLPAPDFDEIKESELVIAPLEIVPAKVALLSVPNVRVADGLSYTPEYD